MNVLENNDLRTLFDHYGLNYRAKPEPGYGAVATLNLNCTGAEITNLEFHENHAVLEILVDYDVEYLPQCHQTDYWLKIKMPIWMAEYIAEATTHRQKEES